MPCSIASRAKKVWRRVPRWTSRLRGMRDRTTVTLPKPLASTNRSGPDTFVVTYAASTPDDAQRIANRLARAFVDQHSKMRETRAEHTSDFLAAQLGQSRDRLKSLEERLRQMKETYMGRLPEQTQGNLQMVGGLRQQQENTSMSLRSDEDRLAMIERQIEAMKGGGARQRRDSRGGLCFPAADCRASQRAR